jgi:hypothetical protein
LVLSTIIAGCSVTPPTIMRDPEVGVVSTSGIGDVMYVYTKTPQVFVDYMNAKGSNLNFRTSLNGATWRNYLDLSKYTGRK